MTATEYITQYETKFCGEAFTCMSSYPTTTGSTFADEFGASTQDCLSIALGYDMPSTVESEITAGKIQYDGSAAASCIAGITFGACSDFWTNGPDLPTACDTALVGTVADGGSCVVDFDCSSLDSYCDATTQKCTPDTSGSAARPRRGFGFTALIAR